MDSSNRESLPVSYIRQFCFCPRIPFLSVFLEIKPPSPLWVQDGVDFHEKAAMLQKRRKLSKFNLSGKGVFKSNIYLKSSVYPIHGIADGIFIMEDGEIIPLEFKAQDNFVASRGHILQLTGYAILLEEKLQYYILLTTTETVRFHVRFKQSYSLQYYILLTTTETTPNCLQTRRSCASILHSSNNY